MTLIFPLILSFKVRERAKIMAATATERRNQESRMKRKGLNDTEPSSMRKNKVE